MNIQASTKHWLAVVILAFGMTLAHSCPPVIESEFSIPGVVGYRHVSYNNQLRRPGEPPRIHQHYLAVGPWQLDVTGRVPIVVGIGIFSALALSLGVWRITRHDFAA